MVISDPLLEGRYEGTILLADISGYTSFLDSVRSAHRGDQPVDTKVLALSG